MEDINNGNNNIGQNNNENVNNQGQTNQIPNNGQATANNVQTPQYNNYQANANNSAKKKSKAPIIIIVVLIVLLLLGCIVFGIIFAAFGIFNTAKHEVENAYNTYGNYYNSYNNIQNSLNNTTNALNELKNKTNQVNNIINNVTNNLNTSTNNILNTNTANNTNTNNTVNTNNTNASAVTDAKTSTKEAPLTKGTWGIASKYSTESSKYENVNVKLTNVVRGEEAKKAVQEFVNKSSYYKYEEPKEGLEWVVIDYDLNFGDFTMSSLGENPRVTLSIKGSGNKTSVIYNGMSYTLFTTYIGTSDYVKEKNTSGKIAFQMPIGCTDYVMQFGEYNETNAFFKGE